MPDPQTPDETPLAPVKNLELKAGLLLALMAALVLSAVLYVLYARGAFEQTRRVTLLAQDSEGISVGMELTFTGFPIGRVARISLGEDGRARIAIDVLERNSHWLRTSSIFTIERGLVGTTRIRAFTGVLDDPLLPDGAEREVLQGDALAELPGIVNSVREVLSNLEALTSPNSALAKSMENVQTVTTTLAGPRGALGVLMGNERDARRVIESIERTNALLARLEGVAGKAESLVGNADQRVFGEGGVMTDVQGSVREVQGLLQEARVALQKVDAVLVEAQAIGSNVRVATADMDTLRAEVEASLRKVQHLVNEINRKWPFSRDAQVQLP